MYYTVIADKVDGKTTTTVHENETLESALGLYENMGESVSGAWTYSLDLIDGARMVFAYEGRPSERTKYECEIPFGIKEQVITALKDHFAAAHTVIHQGGVVRAAF